MFDFEHPIQHDEKPNWGHIGFAGAAVAVMLLVTAFTPDPVGRLGALKRGLLFFSIEWTPLILILVATRLRADTPATAAAIAFTFGGGIVAATTGRLIAAPVGALIGTYLFLAVRVANQWEKCVVLRFGKYHGLRGPGIFRIVPIIDTIAAFVDERVRTTAVHAEAALTRDAVPVHVDAVIFWVVWDVEKAVLELQDFDRTVALVAQTALVESIGRYELGQMIAERGGSAGNCNGSSRTKPRRGASRCSRSRFGTCVFPTASRMRCPARRRPSASARPASSSATPK